MQDGLLTELKDGLSQPDRQIRMLFPDNVEIDGRDPAALMQLTAWLAGQVNYYNADNRIEGDWQDFFVSDLHILVLLITGLDFSSRNKRFEYLLSEARLAASEESFRENLRLLLYTAFELADLLKLLLTRVGGIAADIDGIITGIRQNVVAIGLRLKRYDPASLPGGREKLLPLLPDLQKDFSGLLVECNRLQEISAYYRKNNLWSAQQYTPHLGLFITFLQLYGYLRTQINQLTRKHLDYYYREILGLGIGTVIPDKVHLLFAPDINAEYVRLKAGEEMPAEIPGWEDPLKYRLTTDISVTRAKVAALKTLFVSDRSVFADDDSELGLLRNAQLYQQDNPCISPDLLLKGNAPAAWPLFGEDQEDLPRQERTMGDTDIGLLLAAPIFYLTEGKRKIQLSIYCEPSSFISLGAYIRRFSAASLKTEQAVQNEVLTRAFDIAFTAAEGWSPVEKYTVRIPEENVLEILVELDPAARPFVLYKPFIHGPDYQTALPVLRLLINNGAPHNAFSFLRALLIERIQLKAEVQHFRQVRMQNSIGNLAVGSAFQPFGPQPVVGSYLDIKNSNVFNRYTTDLAIRVEWMDLPKDPGGFATWFAGYNTGVTDASFRVGIGALTNGTAQPSAALQQSFPLYAENPDETRSGPADATWIRGIDIRKLEFLNNPLLAREEEESDGFFRNGAVRLELLSPPEAFGHALFPKIFPEVAMHNARLWKRKLPLPNQPYTPRAKSVSVNYTLEYAEAFKDITESGTAGGGLELIHQYPFGYRKIYPGNPSGLISFLPAFDTGGHLHIGLSNVQREEELSLLFQLEERNFHHTLHDTDPVSWSYLIHDDWVPMDAGSILSDTTHNFISTGIVRLKLPAQISQRHTIWPAGLFWIRASVSGAADLKSKVVAVLAQAGMAERVPDIALKLPDAGWSLPPGSIKNFGRKVRGLQQIWQPFVSFGGNAAEKDEAYYIRVSERLRHKQRPLTSMDIEQLVLEKFPSIAVVKCFGTSSKRQSVYPGVDVQVILIPKEGTDGNFYTDQPKVNLATLFAVKSYLAGFASPFINIEIGNPVYERIKIACRVKVRDYAAGEPAGEQATADAGSGYYLKRLHDDIRQYLCPWLYSAGTAVRIGTRIYIPELLTYLKKLPYIAELTGFSVVHFFNVKDVVTGELKGALIDSAVDPVEFIQGSVPEAVLIPAEHHLIGPMTEGDYTEPGRKGIGDFYIGDELLTAGARHARREGYDETPVSTEDPDEYFSLTIVNPTK